MPLRALFRTSTISSKSDIYLPTFEELRRTSKRERKSTVQQSGSKKKNLGAKILDKAWQKSEIKAEIDQTKEFSKELLIQIGLTLVAILGAGGLGYYVGQKSKQKVKKQEEKQRD